MCDQSLFPVTQWTSVILVIQKGNEERAWEALERFSLGYHGAIRNFFLMRGASPDQADELAQEFFQKKILRERGGIILKANRSIGNFRAFLYECLKGFLADERRRQRAIKRGGQATHESLDDLDHSDGLSSKDEEKFDGAYAETLSDRFIQGEKNKRLLEAVLTEASPKELAREWDMSEGAVRVQLHRFREWLAQKFREEVRNTLGPDATEEDIKEEIRLLIRALVKKIVTSRQASSDTDSGAPNRSPPKPDNDD